jgi:nucleoid-associated protein YgaU
MASSAGTKAYTVVSGDSLYSIAAKTLGDGTQYHKIFEANRDQLKDPDDISEGMVLKVPR